MPSNVRESRSAAARAIARDDQAPMMLSIGCKARLSRTEDAMIAPEEILPSIASNAPAPRAADWMNRRKNRLDAVSLLPANCALIMLASAIRRWPSCRN